METNKSLRTLVDAALHTIEIVITGIVTGLLSRKNDLKAIRFEFIFTSHHDLPGKVSFAFAITLRTGIYAAMTSIKRNYPHIACGALSVGRNAVRRISALQRLLDRLSFNGIAITICIVNRRALRARGAINNRKRIIPVREIHYMFSAITLQNVGYRSKEMCIGFQHRPKYKSSRITSRFRCVYGSLNSIGTYIVKSCGGKAITVIGSSKGNDLISPVGKTRVGKIYILERGITRFELLLSHRSICVKILINRLVNAH